MQLVLPDVPTEATVPEVTSIAHGAANACGAPPPMTSAASDDDANSSRDRHAARRLIRAAIAGVRMTPFEPVPAQALDREDDSSELLAIIWITGWLLRVQTCVKSGPATIDDFATDRCSAQMHHGGNMVNRRLGSSSG